MFGGKNMARKRGQFKGNLYRKGPSWMLRWWEDVRAVDGSVVRIRPAKTIARCKGRDAVSRREAERIAWDEVLSRLDQTATRPQSLMTVGEFWRHKFIPELVWALKPSGRKHYRYLERALLEWCPTCQRSAFWRKPGGRNWNCAKCHPAPKGVTVETLTTPGEFRKKSLREVKTEDVQAIVRRAIDESGLSVQTAAHFRNAVSALFRHAKAAGYYAGENPAACVRLPVMQHKETQALTFSQARLLLDVIREPERTAVLVSMLTSMNVAELAGLRWRRVNLTAELATTDGEALPPLSLAVRENCYRGQFTTLKRTARRRIIPLPGMVVTALSELRRTSKHIGPDDLVFATPAGAPLNENNARRRIIQPAAQKTLGVDWVGWHTFRRCTATWAEAVDMPMSDRMAILGHARAGMTMHYTAADTDRRRQSLLEISELLWPNGGPPVQ